MLNLILVMAAIFIVVSPALLILYFLEKRDEQKEQAKLFVNRKPTIIRL